MKAAVVVFPGINRERDMARAFTLISGRAPAMAWHAETALPEGTDLVVLPGGFSYGDYLRCGAIAARAPIMGAVRGHAEKGGLVLGVCNGFQILCEAGLLPGVLLRNAALKFICRDVHLRVVLKPGIEDVKGPQEIFAMQGGFAHGSAIRSGVIALGGIGSCRDGCHASPPR